MTLKMFQNIVELHGQYLVEIYVMIFYHFHGKSQHFVDLRIHRNHLQVLSGQQETRSRERRQVLVRHHGQVVGNQRQQHSHRLQHFAAP
jgi:hypothetical protein